MRLHVYSPKLVETVEAIMRDEAWHAAIQIRREELRKAAINPAAAPELATAGSVAAADVTIVEKCAIDLLRVTGTIRSAEDASIAQDQCRQIAQQLDEAAPSRSQEHLEQYSHFHQVKGAIKRLKSALQIYQASDSSDLLPMHTLAKEAYDINLCLSDHFQHDDFQDARLRS